MTPSVEKRLVKELADAITQYWKLHCFVEGGGHQWVRRWGWKSDFIRLSHKPSNGVFINFDVFVPPPPDSRLHETVACTDLGYLARNIPRTFGFPRFSWSTSHFVDDIINLMPLGVTWFNEYSTSTACLERLLTPHVNPHSPGFRYRKEFLKSLPEDAAQGACLLHVEQGYAEDYLRSIFDIRWRGPLAEPID